MPRTVSPPPVLQPQIHPIASPSTATTTIINASPIPDSVDKSVPDSSQIGGYALIPLTKSQLELLNSKVLTLDQLLASNTSENLAIQQSSESSSTGELVSNSSNPVGEKSMPDSLDEVEDLSSSLDLTFDQDEILELEKFLGMPLLNSGQGSDFDFDLQSLGNLPFLSLDTPTPLPAPITTTASSTSNLFLPTTSTSENIVPATNLSNSSSQSQIDQFVDQLQRMHEQAYDSSSLFLPIEESRPDPTPSESTVVSTISPTSATANIIAPVTTTSPNNDSPPRQIRSIQNPSNSSNRICVCVKCCGGKMSAEFTNNKGSSCCVVVCLKTLDKLRKLMEQRRQRIQRSGITSLEKSCEESDSGKCCLNSTADSDEEDNTDRNDQECHVVHTSNDNEDNICASNNETNSVVNSLRSVSAELRDHCCGLVAAMQQQNGGCGRSNHHRHHRHHHHRAATGCCHVLGTSC